MRRVEIESPYAGDVDTHVKYARRAMADSLRRGEAPLASHLLYTQEGILDDTVPEERKLGMEAGKVWSEGADARVFYIDYGMSPGMRWAHALCLEAEMPYEFRTIGGNDE